MALIVTPGQLNRRAELYHQLGSMISAGVPLLKALEMVSVNPSIRDSRSTILGLIQHLQSGLTFSESMVRVQGWMPEFDVALLAVGEESGRLDGSFKLLSGYYEVRARIIRDTLAGMMVTVATVHVFLLVFPLNLWIMFAQGILFGNHAQCLPYLIQKSVIFGSLYLGVFALIYACQGKRGESWRALMESVTQVVPLLRTAQKYLVLSRLAAALEALTSAGASIISGWELAGAASGSPRLRRKINEWKPRLQSGATPGMLINQTGYFPEMFANLYNTAEHSGKLEDALSRLQAYYQEEGFRKLRLFTRILNGAIYGLVVLLVAYNVLLFYANYFGQAGQIMKGF
jgi:type II secretory pathway component PulF